MTPEAKPELLNMTAFFATIRAESEAPSAVPELLEALDLESDNPLVVVPLERGCKRGRAEGQAEGALEQARAGLLEVLQCRFGRPSRDIVQRISSITTLEKLKALHGEAFISSGFKDFLEYLGLFESL